MSFHFLIRLILLPFVSIFYRIRVIGRGNVPRTGAALIVSNHISFIDAVLIAFANRRPVRFLMFRRYYDLPVANRLFRATGCIPISDRDSPRALIASFEAARAALSAGELVCIFAEGEISRHGQMLRFKKGLERILGGLSAPVIPVHLDQVWGSLFSFEGGRILFKRPKRMPYPVTVSFGKPLPSATNAFEVRQAIMELGAAAFHRRLFEEPPLPLAFTREAKRHPLRFAVADSLGMNLTYGRLWASAYLLGQVIDAETGQRDAVGIFLPPSAGAVIANIGLSMRGKLPINLNYTITREIVSACADKAGAQHIVTSKRFIDRLGWRPDGKLIFIEDAAAKISGIRAFLMILAFWVLPYHLLVRLFLSKTRVPLDRVATVLFTSGVTGIPKGVMLTHANIVSNIAAVTQVYQIDARDRILGILPFFHAYGLTSTLWLPLIAGGGVIYHYNPLEAQRIGELAREHAATFLIATPTLLSTYIRRIDAPHFQNLKHVIVGAERLRSEIAEAFKQKFGLRPLEGYGCTELSPIAAANIPDIDWPGTQQTGAKAGTVGRPLPGVFMKIVDPETNAVLPPGTPGLLLVKGPNVMKGYLGDEAMTQSAIQDGYYRTGDIASIDIDGFVTITDRLSRFSKIGGEMVPHVLIEEKLHELSRRIDTTFAVTTVPDERRGERLIVLYKDFQDINGLCRKLAASDIPRLWLPDKANFHKVDDLPFTGIGKLDFQKIKILASKLADPGDQRTSLAA